MNAADSPTMVQPARVTYTRRFFGDNILEGILMVVTLFVGWLIWLAIVAKRGQTPAKQLLNVRILDEATGKLASTGQVWQREFLGKVLPSIILSVIGLGLLGSQNGDALSSLYFLVGGIMILANSDDKAPWDYIGKTKLGYFPNGLEVPAEGGFPTPSENSPSQRLLELDNLLQSGSISQNEYQERRQKILDSL